MMPYQELVEGRVPVLLAVAPLVDHDGQRAQLCGRHALLAAAQQPVAQPARQRPQAMPPPTARSREHQWQVYMQSRALI